MSHFMRFTPCGLFRSSIADHLLKRAALGFLVMLLVSATGLTACGGGSATEEDNEVIFGVLADFTGRAAVGTTETYNAFKDYLRMAEEKELLPEASIKVLTYDTRGDFSRVMPGYVWLTSRGAQILGAFNPGDIELLRSRVEEEEIPVLGTPAMFSILDCDWFAFAYGPVDSELEALLQWIVDNWDSYPTRPKIGFVGLTGITFYETQLAMVEKFCAAHPDEVDWVGAEMAPTTTTNWAGEIGKLSGCDYIIPVMSGPSLASFIKEARSRGYTNKFAGSLENVVGFWPLVRDAVPPADLDGLVVAGYYPWYTDDVGFIREVKEYTEKYRPDQADLLMTGTSPMVGWTWGNALVAAVKGAMEEVGVENIDSLALREALFNLDLELDGFGNRWKMREGVHCLGQTVRMYEYDADAEAWTAISDWYQPASLWEDLS